VMLKILGNGGSILVGDNVVNGITSGNLTPLASWIVMLAIVGAADTVSTILRQTIRQLATPNNLRGRMTSVNMIFFMGGPQLGELEAGALAALFGAPFSVVTGGVGCLLAAAIAFGGRTLRRYAGTVSGKQ